MQGSLAIAVLIIVGFVGFVLWAKTPGGRGILEQTFGPPNALPRAAPTRARKRTAAASPRKTTGRKPANRKTKQP